MAKWGEGDARWIVEERADGTNANNWHWTEKNATAWTEKTLKSLLIDLAFTDDKLGDAKLVEMDSITGDCIANCRKGKLIFFYELVLKMNWKGHTKDGTVVNGKLTIPNLSEENDDMDDINVEVTMTSDDSPDNRKVKDLVRKRGTDLIREQLGKWLKSLKEEYALDLIKPTGDSKPQPPSPGVKQVPPVAAAASKPAKTSPAKKAPVAAAVAYKSISLSDEFRCSPDDLFRALVTEQQIRAYTQSDCKVDSKVGGEFSMFGGNVQGVFKELVPGKKISQAWRFKHWPASHFSDVTLTITNLGEKCKLELEQTGVPDFDLESAKAGWRSHQWERMKGILGFGSSISFM